MSILFKQAKIVDESSPFHLQTMDILVENGKISSIEKDLPTAHHIVIQTPQLHISQGWIDMHAQIMDPGKETSEDIHTAAKSAHFGGFTDVLVFPNTFPVINHKQDIRYYDQVIEYPVTWLPSAAITRNAKGEEMNEWLDLMHHGAFAFTDGDQPLHNTDMMVKILTYLRPYDALVIQKPEDKWLNLYGQMHEGKESVHLGLKGMPSLAESIIIGRDLRLLEYSGGKLHFTNISTAESVQMVRVAKNKRLKVSCDVAAHQLVFTDTALDSFDTNFKVNPPFRTEDDRKALLEGILDGTIDAIVSAHQPHDTEEKQVEFDHAAFGAIGFQTAFSAANMALGYENLPQIIRSLTIHPQKLLKLTRPNIQVGQEALFTCFQPELQWTFDINSNHSKSTNSPFWDKKINGKAIGIFKNNQWWPL